MYFSEREWTKQDEKELLVDVRKRLTVVELSFKHDRTVGCIKTKLRKLARSMLRYKTVEEVSLLTGISIDLVRRINDQLMLRDVMIRQKLRQIRSLMEEVEIYLDV